MGGDISAPGKSCLQRNAVMPLSVSVLGAIAGLIFGLVFGPIFSAVLKGMFIGALILGLAGAVMGVAVHVKEKDFFR